MIFRENMIFNLDNEEYRIIGNDSIRSNVFVVELCGKVRWPQVISEEELEALFKNNKAIEIKDDKFINMINYEITEEMIKKRDFYYEIVCFLIKNSPEQEIYYKKSRKAIIDKSMKLYDISESGIKRIVCNYLKDGKIIGSLVPKFHNCGAKGKERTINKVQGIIIDNEIKRIFKEGINKYYNTSKKNNKKICYELIIRDYFKINPSSEIPSSKQFYYWFTKITKENKRNEITKRHGDRIYQQTARAIVGNSIQDTLGPSELYQQF